MVSSIHLLSWAVIWIWLWFVSEDKRSDTLWVTEKYLAENEPYGSVKHERNDHGTEFTQVF